MAKTEAVKWYAKEIAVADIDPTPNNYKIKTDLGKERLQTSINKFGHAGTVVVNPKGKRYILIDGNSRLIQAKERGEKKLWASIPSRPLTPKEYQEMSAMFDYAVAGDVDIERIQSELGNTEDFFKQWGLKVPAALLDKLGSRAEVVTNGSGAKNSKVENTQQETAPDTMVINLVFTEKEEAEFRKLEEKLAKKFKTPNTSLTVLKALKSIKL